MELRCRDRWLVCSLPGEHVTASWAIVGGGLRRARTVAWHQVRDRELPLDVDPVELLRRRMVASGLAGAVGLLTSRRLDRFTCTRARSGQVEAMCVATVGLGNAVRVGSPVCRPARVGTINMLCTVSVALSPSALIEAIAIAAEGRTAAMTDARVLDRWGQWATGTGTDCIVVAAPVRDRPRDYAGKHTDVGVAIGRSVGAAVLAGARAWKREQVPTREVVRGH